MIALKIVTPRGIFLETEVKSIHAASEEGEFTLLSKHMPVVMALVPCRLILVLPDDRKVEFAISGGFLQFAHDEALLLCDAVERKDQIDILRAQEAYRRARERLEKKDTNTNMKRAELSLKRALNRLNVTNTKQF